MNNMSIVDLAQIVLSILAALGGGGAIVAGFSSWLGKVWAERLMEKEKASYQLALEALKAQLIRDNDLAGQTVREKISLYKQALAPIIDLVLQHNVAAADVTPEFLRDFERKRLMTSAMLGMFAPLPVFEAYNALIDYIFDCLEAKREFVFADFRSIGFAMISQIRKDIGVGGGELVYRGPR